MTIEPTDAVRPTEPPAPPQPPRPNRRALAITAAAVGAVLVLGGAAVAGHGAWSLLSQVHVQASPPLTPSTETINPGHVATMPDLAVNGLDVSPTTDAQKVGVVTILTDLYYDNSSQAAGTGSILTSDGEVLTNNHVIEGSTKIEVTVESTGETYDAVVLGTDKTNDVALLQLLDASGLDTVDLSSSAVAVGDRVASIGNAEGTGDLVTAAGVVTATDEPLSIGDSYGGAYESLTGLIEVNADVVSGDSGGPLIDDAGDVVGMVTAASTGNSDIRGYAITIANAMAIIKQIRAGNESGTVNIGPTAFMGVTVDATQGPTGVTLDGSIPGTPADKAGLGAGDVITQFDGTVVNTLDELKALVQAHEPGDVVSVTYTDAGGASQTAQLTLTEGPA